MPSPCLAHSYVQCLSLTPLDSAPFPFLLLAAAATAAAKPSINILVTVKQYSGSFLGKDREAVKGNHG
ncbi:hypothetical protein GQ457_14G020830 [Hibiscus cannabinus]